MSRTYKDKKWSLRYPENDYRFGTELLPYTRVYNLCGSKEIELEGVGYWCRDLPGAKKKKKRSEHSKWLWFQATPSWWTRLLMNKPKRRACRIWEQQVLLQDIEEADCPDYGRKPHIYYY